MPGNQAFIGGGVCCCAIVSFLLLLVLGLTKVEQSEWALRYNYWTESVDDESITTPGMVYIGVGNYLIRFPNTNKYVFFRNFDRGLQMEPGNRYERPIRVRTSDGLAIQLELEFVYRLQMQNLYKLYMLVGDAGGSPDYQPTLVHLATGVIATWSTTFSAQAFYSDRGEVAATFKRELTKLLSDKLYIDVESFQLQPAHFPADYAKAIVETQENKQDIQVAEQQVLTLKIQKQTELDNKRRYAQKITIDAEGEAQTVRLQAEAQAAQQVYRQRVVAEGFSKALNHFSRGGLESNGMSLFLEYLKIEALKAYNSSQKMVRLTPLGA